MLFKIKKTINIRKLYPFNFETLTNDEIIYIIVDSKFLADRFIEFCSSDEEALEQLELKILIDKIRNRELTKDNEDKLNYFYSRYRFRTIIDHIIDKILCFLEYTKNK